MLRFTVEHKYCGCIRVIEGENVYNAYKNSNTDINTWIVKNVEKI